MEDELVHVTYNNDDGDFNRSRVHNGHTPYQYNSYGGQEQFTCSICDRNLAGSRYILKDERPHCIKCYEDRYANTCEECRKKNWYRFKRSFI